MNFNNIYRLILGFIIFGLFSFSFCLASTENPIPEKKIAITFDDGPYGDPTTQVLDILKKENINATFFLMGQNVEKYPEITKRIIADGNVVGNHTYDHPKNLVTMSLKEFKSEIFKTGKAIFLTANIRTDLFRAPYGRISPERIKELEKNRYTVVPVGIDSLDWDYPHNPAGVIEKTVLDQVRPNAIILLHDGRDTKINYPRDNMVTALPVIIEALKKDGYTFVTIDKLFDKKAYN